MGPDGRDSTVTKSSTEGVRFHLELERYEVEGIARCELSESLIAHAKSMLVLAKSDWPKDEPIGFKDVGRDRR